jgi:diacylglycerol kinase family enzyme
MSEPAISAQHVIISVNPFAGAKSDEDVIRQTAKAVEKHGFIVETLTDLELIQSRTASLLAQDKLRTVIAAGGDGTVALLANLLPDTVPLTILPLGTENLLAKYYGLSAEPTEVAKRITQGKAVRVDSGLANGKRFLLMASCGFDADVVTRLHQQRSGHISHSSWAKPIWKSIRKYRYPELRVFVDDHPTPIVARWVFTFNFPCYAMGLPIAPLADPMDETLDLVTFRAGNLVNGLIYLSGVLLRRHRGWRDTNFAKFRRLRIESNEEVPFQIDGDPGGQLPLEIIVQPSSFTLLLPAEKV